MAAYATPAYIERTIKTGREAAKRLFEKFLEAHNGDEQEARRQFEALCESRTNRFKTENPELFES